MNELFLGKPVWLIVTWFLLVMILIAILITATIIFSLMKIGKKISTKIIVQMATFLSIYIVLAFISNIFGEIHIIFNYIVPATVGFIYGPVLGIMFGFTASIVENFVYGGSFGILNLLFNPILGLVSSLAGLYYFNMNTQKITEENSEETKTKLPIAFHTSMVIILLITLLTSVPVIMNSDEFDKALTFIIFSLINLLAIEFFYVYITKYSKSDVDEKLFTLIVIAISIARIFDLLITPFRGYFIGKYEIYWISLLDYTFRSGYMIIIQSFGAYQMLKVTFDLMDYGLPQNSKFNEYDKQTNI